MKRQGWWKGQFALSLMPATWGRGWGTDFCPKADSSSHWQSVGKRFYGQRKGATCRNFTVSSSSHLWNGSSWKWMLIRLNQFSFACDVVIHKDVRQFWVGRNEGSPKAAIIFLYPKNWTWCIDLPGFRLSRKTSQVVASILGFWSNRCESKCQQLSKGHRGETERWLGCKPTWNCVPLPTFHATNYTCYGLNYVSSPNSFVEALMFSVTIFGDTIFRRKLRLHEFIRVGP